ncbi:uncharacterized protein (DUF2249 family) [Sphaerotilus hippei]|uniref:Uncharacterized protein (DUF2249 family) n=1 Tax=Sphaerotilus hippei TaxID=744406 RepID=A0A318GZL1_9BURK|nr:DUF2249 domain-containing protein [Sphaerotilus hippei]PXW93364.1 uncharacterized protein (DUF2249 family) [Sphaerotilus hippei]
MSSVTLLDVRQIPAPLRHATLFDLFLGLPAGDGFELLNDHEPVPLQQQFQARWPGQFDWTVLEAGPAQWRVRITRQAAGKSCCGCCGG